MGGGGRVYTVPYIRRTERVWIYMVGWWVGGDRTQGGQYLGVGRLSHISWTVDKIIIIRERERVGCMLSSKQSAVNLLV